LSEDSAWSPQRNETRLLTQPVNVTAADRRGRCLVFSRRRASISLISPFCRSARHPNSRSPGGRLLWCGRHNALGKCTSTGVWATSATRRPAICCPNALERRMI